MLRFFRFIAFSFLIGVTFTIQAQSVAYQVQSFAQIEPIIKKQHLSSQQTLCLFDIDNTLLVMNNDLGSPAWFSWQTGLVKHHQVNAIASSMNQLFLLNDFVLDSSKMHLSEPDELAFLQHLRAKHFQMIALTAREPAVRHITVVNLKLNHIQGLGFYHTSNKDVNFNSRLYYSKGVLYTAGGDKGKDLYLLLCHLRQKNRFNRFVFVDDTQHNIDVFSHFFAHKINVKAYSFHYRHNLNSDAAFAAENKTQIEKVDQAVLKRYHQQRDNLS